MDTVKASFTRLLDNFHEYVDETEQTMEKNKSDSKENENRTI